MTTLGTIMDHRIAREVGVDSREIDSADAAARDAGFFDSREQDEFEVIGGVSDSPEVRRLERMARAFIE